MAVISGKVLGREKDRRPHSFLVYKTNYCCDKTDKFCAKSTKQKGASDQAALSIKEGSMFPIKNVVGMFSNDFKVVINEQFKNAFAAQINK
jgi:hypothetical protein